jgi:hypothetical protein
LVLMTINSYDQEHKINTKFIDLEE